MHRSSRRARTALRRSRRRRRSCPIPRGRRGPATQSPVPLRGPGTKVGYPCRTTQVTIGAPAAGVVQLVHHEGVDDDGRAAGRERPDHRRSERRSGGLHRPSGDGGATSSVKGEQPIRPRAVRGRFSKSAADDDRGIAGRVDHPDRRARPDRLVLAVLPDDPWFSGRVRDVVDKAAPASVSAGGIAADEDVDLARLRAPDPVDAGAGEDQIVSSVSIGKPRTSLPDGVRA